MVENTLPTLIPSKKIKNFADITAIARYPNYGNLPYISETKKLAALNSAKIAYKDFIRHSDAKENYTLQEYEAMSRTLKEKYLKLERVARLLEIQSSGNATIFHALSPLRPPEDIFSEDAMTQWAAIGIAQAWRARQGVGPKKTTSVNLFRYSDFEAAKSEAQSLHRRLLEISCMPFEIAITFDMRPKDSGGWEKICTNAILIKELSELTRLITLTSESITQTKYSEIMYDSLKGGGSFFNSVLEQINHKSDWKLERNTKQKKPNDPVGTLTSSISQGRALHNKTLKTFKS